MQEKQSKFLGIPFVIWMFLIVVMLPVVIGNLVVWHKLDVTNKILVQEKAMPTVMPTVVPTATPEATLVPTVSIRRFFYVPSKGVSK